MREVRSIELRATVDGRRVSGLAVRYGDRARLRGGQTETFAPGSLNIGTPVVLTVQHQRSAPLARAPGSLTFTDTDDGLSFVAEIAHGARGDQALADVRSGLLAGASIEFMSRADQWTGVHRTVTDATLLGLSLVDVPAYAQSTVEARASELRATGDGLDGAVFYGVDEVVSDRANEVDDREIRRTSRLGRGRRKTRIIRGAFEYALQQKDREILLTVGARSGAPVASRLAGTLALEDTDEALRFAVSRVPSTTAVNDFLIGMEAGAFVPAIRPLYAIPPDDVVDNPVRLVPEVGNPDVMVEEIHQALLTGLALVTRPPRADRPTSELSQRQHAVIRGRDLTVFRSWM